MDAEKSCLVTAKNSLHMLTLFSENAPEQGISDLSRRLGLAKSTVSRMVNTFVHEAILERSTMTRKYRLSPLLLELGLIAEESDPVVTCARGPINQLSQTTGAQASLHLRDEDATLCVYATKGEGFKAGQRMDLHKSLCGLTILAFSEDCPDLWMKHSLTKKSSKLSLLRLLDMLQDIEQAGYAHGAEVAAQGYRSVACPVFSAFGKAVGVVVLTAYTPHVDDLSSFVSCVGKTAQQIAKRIGSLSERESSHHERG